MKFTTVLLVMVFRLLFGQEINVRIDTIQSFVSYTGKHVLHRWTGTSNTINGHFIVNIQDPTLSAISLKIPVISFDSGNSNRDSNMLYTVDEFQYPYVQFKSTTINKIRDHEEYSVKGILYFHGISNEIEVAAKVSKVNEKNNRTIKFRNQS